MWLVMDGRAAFDTDSATVFEVLDDGTRDDVPNADSWRDHDACLCWAEYYEGSAENAKEIEFIKVI